MNKLMKYKGYIGSCCISIEDGVLYGKLECIDDLITYESESVAGLTEAFHSAVDDYLETYKSYDKQLDIVNVRCL